MTDNDILSTLHKTPSQPLQKYRLAGVFALGQASGMMYPPAPLWAVGIIALLGGLLILSTVGKLGKEV